MTKLTSSQRLSNFKIVYSPSIYIIIFAWKLLRTETYVTLPFNLLLLVSHNMLNIGFRLILLQLHLNFIQILRQDWFGFRDFNFLLIQIIFTLLDLRMYWMTVKHVLLEFYPCKFLWFKVIRRLKSLWELAITQQNWFNCRFWFLKNWFLRHSLV